MDGRVTILLYTGKSKRLEEKFVKVFEAQVPDQEIEKCRDVEALSRRLHQPVHDVDVVVLLLSSRDELEAMLAIRGSLWGLRIIPILPDEERDKLILRHRLYPRFVSGVDRGFTDVAAVLARLIERSHLIRRAEGAWEGVGSPK